MKREMSELEALRHLKKVVYQVLEDYEFLDPEGYHEDMVCIPSRLVLSLSRAYSEIGFCKDSTHSNESESEEFKKELELLINKYGIEDVIDIPDFILSDMLYRMIQAMGPCIHQTLDWYGYNKK
jgi:hypothetical protein